MTSLATVPVRGFAPPTKFLNGVLKQPSPLGPGVLSTNQIDGDRHRCGVGLAGRRRIPQRVSERIIRPGKSRVRVVVKASVAMHRDAAVCRAGRSHSTPGYSGSINLRNRERAAAVWV